MKQGIGLKQDFEFGDTIAVNFINLTNKEKQLVRILRNNEDIRKWMYSNHIISEEEHSRFLEGLICDDMNYYWLVKGESGEYLGVIYLKDVDLTERTAFLGIYANPYNKEKGKGKRLIEFLIKISFSYAKLHNLKLEVMEDNVKAIGLYKGFGFKREKILKGFVHRHGEERDVIVMAIINNGLKGENHEKE